MTLRPGQLTESARRLYEDFRGAGLSEAAAVTAATDGQVEEAAMDLQAAHMFGRLSDVEARSRHAALIEAAAARLRDQGVTSAGHGQPVSEAEIDALIAGVFRGTR